MTNISQYKKQRTFLFVIAALVLFCTGYASAQDSVKIKGNFSPNVVTPPTGPPAVATVSGPSSVAQGTSSSNYSETGLTAGSFDSFTWSLSNSAAGTITNGSYNSATVTWNPAFTGNVAIQFSATNSYGTTPGNSKSTYVYIVPVISPASININNNTSPGAISMTNTVDPGGSFQWQSSADGNNWTSITGAYSSSYTPPNLTATTWYRLSDFNDGYGGGFTAYSNASVVTVYPPLVAGAVTLGDQTIYYNHGPAIGCQAPTGGKGAGSYTYKWESSAGSTGPWATVTNGTSASIIAPAITAKTYYHLISSSNGADVIGPLITVTVYPQIQAGTLSPVSEAINYNTADTLSSAAAGGGTGSFTYTWQQSTNGTTFTNTTTTALTYLTGALTATHYYRVICVAPNGDKDTSAISTITVYPPLATGLVTQGNTTVYYHHSATVACGAATGGKGLGSYTYKWESSANGTNWTAASTLSATLSPLTTPILSGTTYYHLISYSNGASVTSATITISVYPPIQANAPGPATQAVNYNTARGTITCSATGGNGSFTYQWQSSPTATGTFTNMAGQITGTLAAANVTATQYYRAIAIAPNGDKDTSTNALVTVYPQLASGLVTQGSANIYYSHVATVACGAGTGGKGAGTYTYQWEKSADGLTGWTAVSSLVATPTAYTTPALTVTTYYRQVVYSNLASAVSATITLTVYPQIQAGTLSPLTQSINYNTAATTITSTASTGGNSTFTYLWQTSTDGTNWTGTGITDQTCETGVLTATHYYRAISTAPNGDQVTSATATVTVYPQLVPGAVTPGTQTIGTGNQPNTMSVSPSGGKGTGSYSYQWQMSADNVTYADVPGATASTYSPPALTASAYYRVNVTSNGVPAYSAPAAVIVTDCISLGTAATGGMNYIATSIFRNPGVTSITGLAQLANMTTCDVMQTIQYLDGLGRPIQTLQVKGSPFEKDLVQPVAYDQFGREATKYLPYVSASADGSYQAAALADQLTFYNQGSPQTSQTQLPGGIPHIASPYAVTNFEASPLNRVLEQGAPGDTWQPNATNPDLSHTIRVSTAINDLTSITTVASTLKVMLYNVAIAADGTRTLTNAGTTAYQPGQLFVTITKDENWQATDLRAGTTQEFKDKEGHIVLKRVFNKKAVIEMLSTYYVYDDLGNLCFVLPPGALPDGGTISQTTLDNLCYQYRYDERNRLVEKKLPGKGKEFMVYNKLDQVVMTQDANQRSTPNQQWTVTKYDVLGRTVVTGLYTHAGSTANTEYRDAMQSAVTANTNLWETWKTGGNGYNTSAGIYLAYPTTLNTTLGVNYYDNYSIPNLPSAYDKHADAAMSQMTRSLPTATLVKVLDGTAGNTNMLWTVSYYDDLGRNIRGFSQHFKGGAVSLNNYDEINNTYDFTNTLDSSSRANYIDNSGAKVLSVTVKTSYDYDHMGRKINTWEEINGNRILLSQAKYNETGQLIDKKLHSANGGSSFLQSVDYRYNSRGWLKSINNSTLNVATNINDDTNDAYGEDLFYDDYITTSLKQYNGNISSASWQSKVPSGSSVTQVQQKYEYTYDRVNRLTKAHYITAGLTGQYDEVLVYDVMGNITSLNRFQGSATTAIDKLVYTYANSGKSNQLISVADTSNNNLGQLGGTTIYGYDPNGNLQTDNKKLLTFSYNFLNLPDTVTKTGTGAGTIAYIYDANGRKLRKAMTGANRDYVNGIEYNNTGAIEFIQTEEGRARPNGGSYFYEYALKDHLGNTRVLIGQDGVIGQQTDYYAFGMELSRGTNVTPSPDNKYKYNGKELQDELGMNLYDYGARFYDPVIGRWTSVDPLAEKGRRWSPYVYAFDDPMRFIDPDGMWPDWGALGRGFKEGFVNNYKSIAHAVAHPIATAKSITLKGVAEFAANMATFGGVGIVKQNIGLAKAVISGDTKTVGKIFGDATANVTTAVITDGVLSAAGKGLSAVRGAGAVPEAAGGVKPSTLEPGPYAGESIPARGKGQTFTAAERTQINEIGAETGCHTCGTLEPGTKSGNFVPDHQPVSALVPDGTPQQLFPQCIGCSRTQGGTVGVILKQQKTGN